MVPPLSSLSPFTEGVPTSRGLTTVVLGWEGGDTGSATEGVAPVHTPTRVRPSRDVQSLPAGEEGGRDGKARLNVMP